MKLCQAGLSGRGIQIQLSTGGDFFPPVLGNSAQLLQVFLHIIRNALDALEHASTPILTVKTLQQAECVILDSDNGWPGNGPRSERILRIVQGHRGRVSCHNRSG
jgi:C4-dicarboxylate-specific signal transduction histidine kinase